MEVCRLNTILSIVFLMEGAFVYFGQSCSVPVGWFPPTVAENVLRASNVVYGHVRKTYPDPRPQQNRGYTVEVEVYCILKGPKTPLVINITEAGYVPAACHSNEFAVNRDYVALETGSLFGAPGSIEANETNLKEIRTTCFLNPVTRPDGSKSTVECPVSNHYCMVKARERENQNDPNSRIIAAQMEYRGQSGAATAPVGIVPALLATVFVMAMVI